MTAASIPPLVTTSLFALIGLFVYQRNPQSSKNRIYALWCLNTVYWQFSWAILFNTRSVSIAKILVKTGYVGIIFLPITFCYLIATFIEDEPGKKELRYAYVVGLLFASSVWLDPLFLNGYYHYPWGYYPRAGYLHPVYLIFLTGMVWRGLSKLVQKMRSVGLSPADKLRTFYMFTALLVYVIASVDFLVNYGLNIYPFGFIFTLLSLCIVSYAIVHHKLLDIRLVLRDSALNLTTGILLAGTTMVVALPLAAISTYPAVIMAVIVMGCLMAFAYDPIRKAIQPAIDRIMFANRFAYLEELAQLPNDILEFANLREMLKFLSVRLKEAAQLESVAVFMYDPAHQSYILNMRYPEFVSKKKGEDWQIPQTSMLVSMLREDREFLDRKQLLAIDEGASLAAAAEMDAFEAAACFPVAKNEEIVGLIMLGPKSNSESFNQRDLKILRALKMRIENFLAQAMTITQEALNMVKDSHDMKNDVNALKGRVTWRAVREASWWSTFEKDLHSLSSIIAQGNLSEAQSETVRQAIDGLRKQSQAWHEEVQRSTPIEDDALKRLTHRLRNWAEYGRVVSEGFRGQREMERVDVVRATKLSVERWRPMAERKNVNLSEKAIGNLFIHGERSLLEQIIENLIDNALKATSDGSVEVISRMEKDSVIVEVKDSGCGIPAEDLPTIFEKPFYQGKGREQLEQSTGVGLYLVAQYAKSLGGRVSAESEVGKGSTFRLTLPAHVLPDRQSAGAAA